jgi:hypothetical protein
VGQRRWDGSRCLKKKGPNVVSGTESGDVMFSGEQLHGVGDAKIELRRYGQELAGG